MKPQPQPTPSADRLPPHSLEAERGVLGCVLYAGTDAARDSLNACEEEAVSPDWFYGVNHQAIYRAMHSLHREGNPVDMILLAEELKRMNLLEEAGGLAYLAELPEATPSPGNLGYYLEILREKFLLRRLVRTCIDSVTQIYAPMPAQAEELLNYVEKELTRLMELGVEQTEQTLKTILLEVMDKMDNYHRGQAQMTGLPTGLPYIDKLLLGMGGDNGNYIVLSGRPGTGKTSLAMQIAEHLTCDYVWFDPVIENCKPVLETVDGKTRYKCVRKVGVPVGVFSLEMARGPLVQRVLFARARADIQRWRTGFAENEAMPLLAAAAADLHKIPANHFLVDDAPRCRIDQLRAKARRWARHFGIRAIIIDYIQLLRASGTRFRDDRVQELAEISAEIQGLGKELNIPLIVLAQMNRDYEKDPTRAPRLSDLKDCGSIEQDADLVGFLYTPKLSEKQKKEYDDAMHAVYGADHDWSKTPRRVNMVWAKNRYGPTGVSHLLFEKSCTRFHDYEHWLKHHNQRDLAQGERPLPEIPEPTSHVRPEDLPSNEELGL